MFTSKITVGIVLYNPNIIRLKENLDAISFQTDRVYLFDNGSANLKEIKSLLLGYPSSLLLVSKDNVGIAAALNALVKQVYDDGYEWIVTLDQDSVAPSALISTYVKYLNYEKIGMLCCKIVDRNFGETSELKSKTSGYEEVPMCITSASMLKVSAWKNVGGFANEFFIDSVDFDMCLLLREHGYKILRTYDTVLLHEVGHSQIRKLFGKEYLVYHHSPIRYYYMIRNGIYLGQRHHFLFHAILRACRQLTMVLLYEDKKSVKLNLMLKGIYHAIIGKYGKYDN